MFIIDAVLVLLILGFAASRYKDGLIETLGKLLGVLGGFVAAKLWYANIVFIFSTFLPDGWDKLVAFAVIFAIINRLIVFIYGFAESILKLFFNLPLIRTLNKILGGAVGIVESFIVLGSVIWIIASFNLWAKLVTLLGGSVVAKYITNVFEFLLSFVL
ncbi:MAG: CvpA family protein [Patescibacteria group bacterium]|nr:CvpA family protein [Patescibacteria group bacterium]MBU2509180.1 CvpA family protein [Patescibacteria group bacterium]